jgi:hypothetical protein
MGAWGIGSFENDDALDWVIELEEAKNFRILADAFDIVLDQKDNQPDAHDCTLAICAAEVTAGLLGYPADDLPDEVLEWLDGRPDPSEALVKMAHGSLSVILEDSELKLLWEETDEFEEWQEIVYDLQERLEE